MKKDHGNRETIATDFVRGARNLACFLYGKDDNKTRRKVYALDKKAYGLHHEGKVIVGRKSTILRKIAERE